MNRRGYTLIELLVAISISSVLLLAIDKFTVNGIVGVDESYNRTLVLSNAKTAVSVIANEVRESNAVEADNSQPDSNSPGAPSNLYSWSGAAGYDGDLILAVPSVNASGSIIYVDGLHTQLYTDDIVYYLNSSTHKLYRRYIANSTAPGNAGVTTCPPTKATPSCPSDAVVVDDVASLSTTYYDSSGNSITSPSGTEAVQYTLTETRTIFGHSVVGTYTTEASLRNK